MSVSDVPGSGHDRLVRRLTEVGGRLRPDPLFERRLRGEIVNRHVALREGRITVPRDRRREMGMLGRAALYASFALAVGTTAVGAASQGSVPGDPLYPIKLRIEEMRIEVAPPWARPRIVAARLDERLAELEVLAGRGDWPAVDRAAVVIDAEAMRLEAFGLGSDTPGQDAVAHHAEVLTTLAAEAPEAAQPGLARAIKASSAVTDHGRDGQGPGDESSPGNSGTAPGHGQQHGATPPEHPTHAPKASHSSGAH